MQNSVVISHTVCAHVGGTKDLGDAGALPFWDGDVADPNMLLPTCQIRSC